MKTLFAALYHALSGGEGVALVTVIASSGSTPRGVGARMLVTRDGRLAGTVGGGAVEHHCILLAQEQLLQPHPCQTQVTLDLTENASLGMVCGGRVDIHFLCVSPGDRPTLALCEEVAARFATGAPFWLITPLCTKGSLSLWPASQDSPGLVSSELDHILSVTTKTRIIYDGCWFCEQLQGAGVVYIFGGGHVAQALVPVLAPLDFACVVLEDREEFSDPALFPLAREVRRIDFSRVNQSVSISENDYVCIMTRGHQNDLLIQQQVLLTPAQYIGLIGSARKAAAAFASLERMGFSKEDLSRIVTPIGLPIGGETPAEIAISIAAQLIQHRSAEKR